MTSAARPISAVLAGGLCAGTLDIVAACTLYGLRGVSPMRILQSIASGVLGVEAFQGGMSTAALGLLLHFFIAGVAAWVYYLGSSWMPILAQRPVVCGACYGIGVYVFMNFVVLPLSAVTRRPFSPGLAAIMVVIHIGCVGIPIALAVRRFAGAPAR